MEVEGGGGSGASGSGRVAAPRDGEGVSGVEGRGHDVCGSVLGVCDEGCLVRVWTQAEEFSASPPDALVRAQKRRWAELHSGTLPGSSVLDEFRVSPARRVADQEPVDQSFLTRRKLRTTKGTVRTQIRTRSVPGVSCVS